MKSICLLFLLLIITTFAFSQNYYVATVKGKVYYKNKLLKKRDKVKMKGNLRFSSLDDYVKLSGPGGLFTINPKDNANSRHEFLVAVREELFPKTRPHATTAFNIVMDNTSYFDLKGYRMTFFDHTPLYRTIPVLKSGEELGFLHETNLGLVYRPAQLKDSFLLIRKADFILPKVDGQTPILQQTAIVKVMNKERWEALIQSKDSIKHLDGLISRYGWEDFIMEEETVVDFPGMILDFMKAPRFIEKRALVKDLRFHLRKCNAPDIETFLENYEYESYIWETYGFMYGSSLDDVLRNDLHLHSKYNSN